MKLTVLTISVAFAGLAAAQSLSDLPSCAQACVGNSFGGCGPLDIKCICANKDLINGLACCIQSKCAPADQQRTIQFASQLCATQNIQVPQSATCASGAAAGSTGTSSGTSTSSSATGSMASSSMSASSASSASSATSMSSSMASASSSAAAASSTAAAASASSTAKSGGSHLSGSGMGAAGAIVAALALL